MRRLATREYPHRHAGNRSAYTTANRGAYAGTQADCYCYDSVGPRPNAHAAASDFDSNRGAYGHVRSNGGTRADSYCHDSAGPRPNADSAAPNFDSDGGGYGHIRADAGP